MKKLRLFVLLLIFVLAASAVSAQNTATYRVTITNLTGGQPLTPPLIAVHRQSINLFEIGQPASPGIQEIAENGNLAPLVDVVSNAKHVHDFVVAVAGDPPPVMPGQSVTVELTSAQGAKYLSFASMLICTNDGFTGVDSVRLPKQVGDSATLYANGYDAGTEINTEDFADIVPPCPALTGVPSSDPGTGTSNPALAENGVIRLHPGIVGNNDLQAGLHGWNDPVAQIVIERIS